VCQRKRFGVVLLLVAGLASLLARPVPAQNAPSSWAAPGALRADAGVQPQVIASTKTTPPPTITGDSKLPPPDDGLTAPKAKDAVEKTPVPPPPPPPAIPEIQQAGYVPQKPKPLETKPSPTPSMVPGPLESRATQEKWENAAQLAVLVQGPENAKPGQAIACQILVKNRGAQMLAEVSVVLPIPPGARIVPTDPDAERQNESLSWKLGNLEPQQERVVRFEVQSAQPGEVHLRPRATFGPGAGLRTSVVRPPFSLSVTGPEGATVGETIVFNVLVGNHTSSPIENVNLRCELSDGLVHAQGREVTADLAQPLLPSQVRSIPLETVVRAPGRQQITVNATAIGGHRGQASWSVPVSEAGLVLEQHGPRQANVGEVLEFRLEIRNPGRSAVGPVRLSQTLPEGIVFGSASTAGMFEVASQSIVWTLPTLQAGEMQAVTFTAQGRKPGDWAMPVSAGASGIAEARVTHAVRIDSAPTASLTLKTQDDRVALNGETVCEARLYNQGPNNMRDARLVVQLPEGLDVVSVEGPTPWQHRGKQILFEPMVELRPRIDAIYRVRVRAVSGTGATIQAELNAAGMDKPQQAFRAIRIAGSDGVR
jgi:uncharacterized repeat protein (TIGR01451 family)